MANKQSVKSPPNSLSDIEKDEKAECSANHETIGGSLCPKCREQWKRALDLRESWTVW